MKNRTRYVLAALAVLAAGCAGMSDDEAAQRALQVMKASFNEKGQARLDRLNQDEAQKLCSVPPATVLPKETVERIEKANLAAIRYPADGKLLGDWKSGERIAQTGTGMQFSDNPKQPSGANCYACHQLSKAEISFGTIGPSLYRFGALRGTGEATQRYVYGKIFDSQASTACSQMPRFGHNGVLTEEQIMHLVALLLDPDSPVNK
jgi:L-cysteine S-thiosulfotransferase